MGTWVCISSSHAKSKAWWYMSYQRGQKLLDPWSSLSRKSSHSASGSLLPCPPPSSLLFLSFTPSPTPPPPRHLTSSLLFIRLEFFYMWLQIHQGCLYWVRKRQLRNSSRVIEICKIANSVNSGKALQSERRGVTGLYTNSSLSNLKLNSFELIFSESHYAQWPVVFEWGHWWKPCEVVINCSEAHYIFFIETRLIIHVSWERRPSPC